MPYVIIKGSVKHYFYDGKYHLVPKPQPLPVKTNSRFAAKKRKNPDEEAQKADNKRAGVNPLKTAARSNSTVLSQTAEHQSHAPMPTQRPVAIRPVPIRPQQPRVSVNSRQIPADLPARHYPTKPVPLGAYRPQVVIMPKSFDSENF